MFAGLISKEKPISAWGDPGSIIAALAPYSPEAPRAVWNADSCMLMQVATTTGVGTGAIYQHPESGVAVVLWGRLDNRPDLISQLAADSHASDDELIALAWLKWGELCPEKLIGDFAFAVSSPRAGVVFLARDVMGVKPLYYRADDNGVFFANSAAAFKALNIGTLTPSKRWTAQFLIYLSCSPVDTAYEEIKKLPPAHSLLIDDKGRLTIRRYHQFVDDTPRATSRDPVWLEKYRTIWQESVACRLPKTGLIGCENSGGLDSGSITSEVARLLGNDIDRLSCFGYSRERLEPGAIMSVAMKFGIAHNFISSRPYDYHYLPEVIDRSLAVNGYPIEIGVAEDHDQFYGLANMQGASTLFSGFGGDELVTSENYNAFEEFFDAGEYRNLLRITPGKPIRKVYRAAKFILSDIRRCPKYVYHRSVFKQRWAFSFFTDEMEAEFGLQETFIGANDYIKQHRNVNTLSLARISLPYLPLRLENCTLMASSYGLDYVWPLLDQRLIQQWLNTPTLWKIGDGQELRYLHRRAVAGVCPDQIANKSLKDMGGQAIMRHFAATSNRHHFQQLLDMADELPPSLFDIIDVRKLRAVAESGLSQDARGYEIFSAMLMLNWNLQALVAWRK